MPAAVAPLYSLDRRKSGPTRSEHRSKLSWPGVREIRRWATCEGFGYARAEQIRILQGSLYGTGLSDSTLRQVLDNTTWFDPTYTPGEMSEAHWGQHSVAHNLILTIVERICTPSRGPRV